MCPNIFTLVQTLWLIHESYNFEIGVNNTTHLKLWGLNYILRAKQIKLSLVISSSAK